LGERLLCKQEVVGSIPSASMALPWGLCFGGWARRHGEEEGSGRAALCRRCWAGLGAVRFVVLCSLWIVNQVLVRLWTRGTSRWALAALFSLGGGAVRG